MTSMPSDQAVPVHSTALRTYGAELALPTLVAGGAVYVGTVSTWQVCLLAAVPVAFAIRHILRTRETERRWAVIRWLAAEARWRASQQASTVGELETADASRRPLVVDGGVVEAGA